MEFTDQFLAYLELKQDMFFHKIPKEKILSYIEESLKIGESTAAKQTETKIDELYRQKKIIIKREPHDGRFFKVQLRAQFEENKKGSPVVYLYQESVKELSEANHFGLAKMNEVILAHEFFHFLENESNRYVSEILPSVVRLTLFSHTRKAAIQRTSEIAANAFAKKLLKLEYLPNYFDYYFLLQKKELSYKDLEEEYEEFQEICYLDKVQRKTIAVF
ncbi:MULTISPECIES: hypothetical protein [unclassified Enterococcus]|jgi:hypothetical protein|uniref:hypothetical protein n=1 Tax=unclassified Enterococcus TaxID=2608891 RepID=UPI000352761D|nr:hypothetical protein D920_00433 [Enterococcus faecalis 13-SD-W-01]